MITKRFNINSEISIIVQFRSLESLESFESYTGLRGYAYG